MLITTFLFWNYLEVTTALLAACLPTLRGLVTTSSIDSKLQSIVTRIQLTSKTSTVSLRKNSQQDEAYIMTSGTGGEHNGRNSADGVVRF